MKRSLLDATAGELKAWIEERGHPSFHANQVLRWVFQHRAERFEGMSDLPGACASSSTPSGRSSAPRSSHHREAPDGTDKLLLACRDGRRIECVLMAEEDRRTVCISTQVGCGMGCVFCASGLKGVERNLTQGEIVEQVIRLRNLLPADREDHQPGGHGDGREPGELRQPDRGARPDLRAEGLGLGQRRVTISTVGLPEKMERLAALDRPYHLAVSLHAPTEALRDELVPINAKVGPEGGRRGGRCLLPAERPPGYL